MIRTRGTLPREVIRTIEGNEPRNLKSHRSPQTWPSAIAGRASVRALIAPAAGLNPGQKLGGGETCARSTSATPRTRCTPFSSAFVASLRSQPPKAPFASATVCTLWRQHPAKSASRVLYRVPVIPPPGNEQLLVPPDLNARRPGMFQVERFDHLARSLRAQERGRAGGGLFGCLHR